MRGSASPGSGAAHDMNVARHMALDLERLDPGHLLASNVTCACCDTVSRLVERPLSNVRRRARDSNPRGRSPDLAVFKTSTALSRPPSLSRQDARASIAGTEFIPRISRAAR